MNKISNLLFISLFLFLCSGIFAQNSCQNPQMIGPHTYNLPLQAIGTPAPAGNEYDCLLSYNNPNWFYFEIAQAGDIHFELLAQADVDFILYGPFSSLTAATVACGQLGTGGANGLVVDCGFDPTGGFPFDAEHIDVLGAQAGQIYILLITDYYGQTIACDVSSLPTPNPAVLALPNGINPHVINTCPWVNVGSISTAMRGGTPPYRYLWSNGATTANISGLAVGNYSVTVTDATGATSSVAGLRVDRSDGVYSWRPPVTICGGDSVFMAGAWRRYAGAYVDTINNPTGCDSFISNTLIVNYEVGQNFYNFCFGDSVFAAGAWRDSAGYFYDTITVAGACDSVRITIIDFCTPVWPGDANDDLVVDGNDWLQVGLANGLTGTTRHNARLNWVAQPAEEWAITIRNTDAKHSDTDGNGLVDNADTLAIMQNYGLTHSRDGANFNVNNSATIRLIPREQQYKAGDTVVLDLELGDTNAILADAYGYFITVDLRYLARAGTVQFSPSAAFLGAPSELWTFYKMFNNTSLLHIAQVRFDQIGRSGHGKIGEISFVLSNSNLGGYAIGLRDYKLINNIGAQIPATTSAAVIEVILSLQHNQANAKKLQIIPNPVVNQSFAVWELTEACSQAELKIYNSLGQLQHSQLLNQLGAGSQSIALPTNLPAGAYVVEISHGQQRSRSQFIQLR